MNFEHVIGGWDLADLFRKRSANFDRRYIKEEFTFPPKNLLHKNMLMIWLTISYYASEKKIIITMTLKTVTFLCKMITHWYTTNHGIQIHCK